MGVCPSVQGVPTATVSRVFPISASCSTIFEILFGTLRAAIVALVLQRTLREEPRHLFAHPVKVDEEFEDGGT